MKIVLKLVYNVFLGAIALIVINLAGQLVSFKMSLNLFTAAVVGILGIPGFILLTVLKIIFLR
jgi:inhibitor of the pro-sigma K processing machinery